MGLPSIVHPAVEDSRREHARYSYFPGLPGTELLTARFVTTSFTRHTHPTYTIGVITGGVEEFTHPGGTARVGPGGLALVHPGEVHTGHAGVPEGWGYRVFYPPPEVVEGIGRELGMRGTPTFSEAGPYAPGVARLLAKAHLSAEAGDPLAASSRLREGLALLLRSHGRAPVPEPARVRARPEVTLARDILAADLLAPPTLEELGARVGLGPFALNRAFRAAHGLPPHAYLNQLRVERARGMLRAGHSASWIAPVVGFADQAHLTRHFKRHLGVPPGAYQRSLLAD